MNLRLKCLTKPPISSSEQPKKRIGDKGHRQSHGKAELPNLFRAKSDFNGLVVELKLYGVFGVMIGNVFKQVREFTVKIFMGYPHLIFYNSELFTLCPSGLLPLR